MSEVMLEVKNLSKSFRLRENRVDSLKASIARLFSSKNDAVQDFHALTNVSFNLERGEALGIIGKNGAGKSTLLRILSGISEPDNGEINFYGKAVSILDIGAGFHPELTGRENIYLSASLYKFTRKKIEERFAEIVDFSGIGDFIDEPVKNYSSGMYLRLAFSIITCLDADIYLIDEVVNVGDANFQVKCKNRIEELIAAGKTLLIASHNMNEISILCNRIILMEHGQIVETGGADIIQKYMTIALPQYFHFEGKEFFHVRNLSESPFEQKDLVIGNYGLKDYQVSDEGISTNHPFVVFLEVELTKAINAEMRLKFYDATGALIFTCSSGLGASKMNDVGKYKVEFKIPANLLNTRFYSIELRVVNLDNQTLMFKADKFIAIKMADDNAGVDARRESILQGLVKPLVPVSVTRC
jgi:ABC-type polysaccharide/polyol phosphate transport system ATPase subunit